MKKHFIFTMPTKSPGSLEAVKTVNASGVKCLNSIEAKVSFPVLVAIKNTVEKDETFDLTIIKVEGHDCTPKNSATFDDELRALQYGYDLYDLYDEYYTQKKIQEIEEYNAEHDIRGRKKSEKKQKEMDRLKREGLLPDQLKIILSKQRQHLEVDEEFNRWFDERRNEIEKNNPKLFNCNIKYIETTRDESQDTHTRLLIEIIKSLREETNTNLYVDLTFGPSPIPILMSSALKYLYNSGKKLVPKAVMYSQPMFGENNEDLHCNRLFDVSGLLYVTNTLERIGMIGVTNDPIKVLEDIINDSND